MKGLKYLICYLCEKHHRKVFDKWYVQDVKITWRGKIDCWVLNLIHKIIPDYRRYLRSNHVGYGRYTEFN